MYANCILTSPHLSNAMNSNFIVDMVIIVCFEDFHETAAPPSVSTYHYGILTL